MIGRLYINGKDAWLTWGAFLEDGSSGKLLTPPNNKPYVVNKSRAQAGKQVLIMNPQPEDRDVQLVICISARDEKDFLLKYKELQRELNRGLIQFKALSVYTIYYFTTEGYTPLSYYERLGKIAVRFNEPNPKDQESTLVTAYILVDDIGRSLMDSNGRFLVRNIK